MLQVTFESDEELDNEQARHVDYIQKQQTETIKRAEAETDIKRKQTEKVQIFAAEEAKRKV